MLNHSPRQHHTIIHSFPAWPSGKLALILGDAVWLPLNISRRRSLRRKLAHMTLTQVHDNCSCVGTATSEGAQRLRQMTDIKYHCVAGCEVRTDALRYNRNDHDSSLRKCSFVTLHLDLYRRRRYAAFTAALRRL